MAACTQKGQTEEPGRFDGFRHYLKHQKNASDNTAQAYLRDIAALDSFCGLQGDLDYQSLSQETLQGYFEGLESQGKSAATLLRHRASLSCYYSYLIRLGVVSQNLPKQLRLPAQPARMPASLSLEQVDRLLAAPMGDSFKARRDKAMLELLYACGLRVSELLSLETKDVNLQLGFVHIQGTAARDLPLYPSTMQPLRAYLGPCRDSVAPPGQPALFVNHSGSPMTRQGFWKILRHYARQAGLEQISPQQLRHSLAVHLLQNGAALQDVQAMLGHTDIASTQVYARLFQRSLQEKYRRFHPRGREEDKP